MKIEEYRTAFLTYLKRDISAKEPRNLYNPINYIMTLGGKRMRPVLVLIGCHLFSDEFEKAMEAAMSVEMFHNFTLIHDDIMDSAGLRRGKETVHKKWNLNTGILSGDALMIMSNQRLEAYEGPIFKSLITLYNKTALEVCEGQQLDIDFEGKTDVKLEEYIKMISFKTAVLVGAALKMGSIIGQADHKDQQRVYDFGLNLGIAFQLQDDFLDTYGGEDFGKRIGGDILEGKKTFLYIKALEASNEDDKNKLLSLYEPASDQRNKIKDVKSIFNKYNVDKMLLEKIEAYTKAALSDIDGLSIALEKKKLLKEFALNLMKRTT
ncbi:polyprenyl synthetase family protein [Lutimonas zeaxanthinifaciens]|uniref:polyprenyl synthetase family protein n=1 Tax=Lutimonas zeaxanthinifaciens TaxID=3060215 RepID=UPI00265D0133|nr:polyprenyl synthetase family protein [Lutimonas sp. YSD2104]WKK65788.1 polyprenyl synthetase family protein [Lutimonas sp. YSD2104]